MIASAKYLTKVSLTVFFCAFTLLVKAQNPNWTVNTSQFSNSMNVIGFIQVSGTESRDVNDKVGAFIGGELRGVASPEYVAEVDRFVVLLTVFSNGTSGEITFKVYDASADVVFDATSKAQFAPGGFVGGLDESFTWSDQDLNNEAVMNSFSIPSAYGTVTINGLNITINASLGSGETLANQIATFQISQDATVSVGGINQVSGVTANDFSQPVTYRVQSEDLLTVNEYVVTVSVVNTAPTAISLNTPQVEENLGANTLVSSISTTDADNGDTHSYTLVSGTGADDNSLFKIQNSTLLLNQKLSFEDAATRKVRIRSTDSFGVSIEQALVINVLDVNDVPTGISMSSQSIDENLAANVVVAELSALDQDNNETFNFELVSGAGDVDNGLFEISGNQLKAKVSFNHEQGATRRVRLKVTDASGASYTEGYQFTINDINDAPVVNKSISDAIIAAKSGLTINYPSDIITDEDEGDQLAFSLVMGDGTPIPGWIVFNAQNRIIVMSPKVAQVGEHQIKLRATDAQGLTAETSYQVIVSLVLDANDENNISDEVSVYPNPSNAFFNIDATAFLGKPFEVRLFSMSLKETVLQDNHDGQGKFEISTSGFTPGLYLLELSNSKKVARRKLIIVK